MDGRYIALYCVLTLLTLSKLTISFDNNGLNKTVHEEVTFNGAQVLQVEFVNPEPLNKIVEQRSLDVWATFKNKANIMVKKKNLEIVKNELNNIPLKFEVMIEDLQRLIDQFLIEQNRKNENKKRKPGGTVFGQN